MSGHNSITTECKDTSTALDPEVEAAAAFLMSDDTAYEAEPDAARRVATLMLEAASRAAADREAMRAVNVADLKDALLYKLVSTIIPLAPDERDVRDIHDIIIRIEDEENAR